MKQSLRTRWLTILILLAVTAAAVWMWSVWSRIYEKTPQPSPDGGPITNILILGVDQDNNEPGRADSIIVMSIHNQFREVSMVSIPRDSRVEIPGYGVDKINHAMAFGEAELMRETVENLLGVPVHYYVYTHFAGFQAIVDTLGGVEVRVEREIIGQDGRPIVEAGLQQLNGRQTLTYVRFRSDAEGDFGRMRRQQQVLRAIGRRMMEPANVLRMPSLLEQFARDVRTDLPPAQFLSLGRTLLSQEITSANAISLVGSPTLIDGISYVILDEEFLEKTVRRYLRWQEHENDANEDKSKIAV